MIKKLDGVSNNDFLIGMNKNKYYTVNLIKSVTTTNSTVTTCYSFNVSDYFKNITNNYRILTNTDIIANRTDTLGESADFKYFNTFSKTGTGLLTSLANTSIVTRRSDNQWTIEIVANTTNSKVDFKCKGRTGRTIDWYFIINATIFRI